MASNQETCTSCIFNGYICFVDFDQENHSRYRMTLSLGIDGEGMVGYAAVHQSGAVQDLGVAFVNLPSTCWAASSCSSAGDVAAVKVYYHSGPEGNISLSSFNSSSCHSMA